MRKTIGVFFGSRSPEHDISIITGQLIISGLRELGYPVVPVYISKQGEWLLGEELGELKKFTNPDEQIVTEKFSRYYLDLETSVGKLVFKKKGWGSRRFIVDIAFPALHGAYGEDGTIQGLFEMLQVPYVGCGVTASALAMDKVLTKQFYEHHKIPTTKFVYFTSTQWEKDRAAIIDEAAKHLRMPVFIKPARTGSSIGISKAENIKDLEFGIEVALHYDSKVIIEKAVKNLMDVTCAVLGNENPRPSLLQESLFAAHEFFTYEEKYLKGGGAQLGKAKSGFMIPARLSEEITEKIQMLAVKIFQIFGCSGIARVDFLFDKKTKQYYANEINTLPGTLYHHLWKKSGVDLPELLETLLQLALGRHAAKRQIASTFASDILRQAGSAKIHFEG